MTRVTSVLQNKDSPLNLVHRAHLYLSSPDLTIYSSDLLGLCQLDVLDDIGDDHKPILSRIIVPCRTITKMKASSNFRKASWKLFNEITDQILTNINANEIEKFSEEKISSILSAALKCIPRGYRTNYEPFWN